MQSVGPKVALAVLSGGSPRELLAALAAGDAARFQAVPGIGKRTAERIIVELREKVAPPSADGRRRSPRHRADDPHGLAREGLLGLGFAPPEVDALLADVAGDSAEALIAARPARRPADDDAAARIQTPGGASPRRTSTARCAPSGSRTSSASTRSSEQLALSIEAARRARRPARPRAPGRPARPGQDVAGQIVAAELGVAFVPTAGPALERKGDVAAFLTALEPRAVFFVDEIHRLPRALEETFYPAMEDRQLPITVGQGAGARVVTLDLPPFTLIGATTRAGLLTTPLRDRFGIQHRLEHYDAEDLARDRAPAPPRSSASPSSAQGARAIAARCARHPARRQPAAQARARLRRGPRRRAPSPPTRRRALDLLEVDDEGLDRLDRELLRAICEQFGGGPVGLSTLAVAVGEEQDTIEDVYEPYLLQRGSSTARRAAAWPRRRPGHLGLEPPPEAPAVLSGARSRRLRARRARVALALLCRDGPPLHLPELRHALHRDRSHRRLPPRGPRAARAAASASCSSCSTTTTRRPTPRSSSATARAA